MITLSNTEDLKVIGTLVFLRKYRFFVVAFILWALIIIPWNITSLIMLSSNGTQAGWDQFCVNALRIRIQGTTDFQKIGEIIRNSKIVIQRCGRVTKYNEGSGNAAIPDGASGPTLYKYDTFMKSSRSHDKDVKPITLDITRKSPNIYIYLNSQYIYISCHATGIII